MSLENIEKDLQKHANKEKAVILQRFFKTGPGEYGEGDLFIGVPIPQIRQVAKAHKNTPLSTLKKLIRSPIHEERMLALLMMVALYEKSAPPQQAAIFQTYQACFPYVNNWDLVDLSAPPILGSYLFQQPLHKQKKYLHTLAASTSLWERRIAIIATYFFIRQKEFRPTLKVSALLLRDKEDLIHKAVGWMLREVGKKDRAAEEGFLKQYYKKMPRTMLRYAIEKFEEPLRQDYLKGRV